MVCEKHQHTIKSKSVCAAKKQREIIELTSIILEIEALIISGKVLKLCSRVIKIARSNSVEIPGLLNSKTKESKGIALTKTLCPLREQRDFSIKQAEIRAPNGKAEIVIPRKISDEMLSLIPCDQRKMLGASKRKNIATPQAEPANVSHESMGVRNI